MTRCRLAALAGAAVLLTTLAPATATTDGWYTPELARRVDAAGAAGVPLPAGGRDDVPSTTLTYTGIRPGTWLVLPPAPEVTDVLARCTANFVYQPAAGEFDPAGVLYLATAAHCVTLGQPVHAVVVAPGTSDPVVVRIGVVVLDSDTAADFALVEIDPAFNGWVSPMVAGWAGPTAVYGGPGRVPAVLSGHGTVVGTGGTARPGFLGPFDGGAFVMNVVGADGDSGAPIVTADGLAVGHLRTVFSLDGISTSIQGRSVQQALAVTDKAIATCPVAVPWPLPGCPT
jgi:hypothetical protein